jgi:hypothetical protein
LLSNGLDPDFVTGPKGTGTFTGEVVDTAEDTYDFGVPDNTEGDVDTVDGTCPALAKLSTNLFLCFLIILTSSAKAAALYCSFISALANARASASGLLRRLVSGTYTSTRCPPSPCFTFTSFEYPFLTGVDDIPLHIIYIFKSFDHKENLSTTSLKQAMTSCE